MESRSDEAGSMAKEICSQIASIFSKPTHPYPPPLDVLVNELTAVASRKARVFLYGVGREGLMLKALCMRLAHLGLQAHLVFDMTTPPIGPGDLLVASAGPGGFSTVEAICGVARSNGGRVLLLTAQPETGSCVREANAIAYVAAQTMADDEEGEGIELLPMGSLYEGGLFVLFEMVVYKLGEALDLASSSFSGLSNNYHRPSRMESTVQMPKAETPPFWTEEKHVHFLNTMEASFVRTMLLRNGRDSSGSWQLRLDRHLPDSWESTLDSEASRNSKKKHAASGSDSLLMMGPRSRAEKRRSTRRRRRRSSHQLQNSSMVEEEQVVPEIEIGGREDAGFVGEHHKH
ncbi:hypothetical protein PIB30_005993 [Stylosanthes scabra]|uniref:3-hexulose-6-phosphate isomerase n=1 Tax=Stylosanthes scabra TaxID=79078 RepID=A0ABU6T4Y2_9FABA|nr:hypothetical protein [Stylosanthes scabra]